MTKKLAIKGHLIRGKEVIELLEMMGGKNVEGIIGTDFEEFYTIEDNCIIRAYDWNNCVWFTLEEFLKTFPFKVGDIIKFPNNMVEEIAEMKWDGELEDIIYTSVSGVKRPCQVPKNINHSSTQRFDKDCLSNTSKTVEEEPNQENVETKIESTGFVQMGKFVSININNANYEDEVELQLEDYEIVVRDGKTYAVRKKPKYPTIYEECLKDLGYDDREIYCIFHTGADERLFEVLYRLKVCRDAYWKIYGEEMGLEKPWKPDWKNGEQKKYCIYNDTDDIYEDSWYFCNAILAFPTEEMRDTFREHFDQDIEKCKELL